jgi:acetyl-CoA carboxylase biotin carboxyl carrier protein
MATSKTAARKTTKPSATKKATPAKAATKVASKATPKVSSKPATPAVKSAPVPNPVFNINEINELMIAVSQSNINELKLEKGDVKITIKQGGVVVASAPTMVAHAAPAMVSAPMAAPVASSAPAVAPQPVANEDNLITIKSPMIGTFYRASGPGKPIFVNVGDEIKEGQVLCIVEAMKLFNEIESEYSGKIVKVLVDDASPVEYDQPLFLVQP